MSSKFEIPLMNQRALFGSFLAAHAIPDALDILFTGVGCKPKAQRQIAQHDRFREAGSKMVWADIGEREAIGGPLDRLENITLETVSRRGQVGIIFVATSAAAELLSADLRPALARIRRRAGCPVVLLPSAGWDRDMYAGYGAAQRAVLDLVDWKRSPARGRSVGIVGHWFHRYESDQQADLDELRRLLKGAGAEPGPVFFSGAPLAKLLELAGSAAILRLPYLLDEPLAAGSPAPARAVAHGHWGRRPVLPTALPVGTAHTESFVLTAAQAAGAGEDRARRFVREERARLQPVLRRARRELAGKRALVLADTPLAAGLCCLLPELGVRVPLAVLLDETLGGRKALQAELRTSGVDSPPVILENPGYMELERAFEMVFGRRGGVDFIVGPDLWLPPRIREGAAWMELGFPSNRWHPSEPAPVLGFSGLRALAKRLLEVAAG